MQNGINPVQQYINLVRLIAVKKRYDDWYDIYHSGMFLSDISFIRIA